MMGNHRYSWDRVYIRQESQEAVETPMNNEQ